MLVKDWMSKPVITVEGDASIVDVTNLLKEHHIRHVPVVAKGKVIGIITDRDLKRVSASDANTLDLHELLYLLSRLKVKKVMTPDPVWVPEEYTVEEAANLFFEHQISGLPVINNRNELVGIITQTDLLRVMMARFGPGKRGIEFALLLEDRIGSIQEVIDVIRKYGGRLNSVIRSFEQVPDERYRRVYIRFYGIDRHKLPQLKEELKEKARLLYMVDLRENIREIYEES